MKVLFSVDAVLVNNAAAGAAAFHTLPSGSVVFHSQDTLKVGKYVRLALISVNRLAETTSFAHSSVSSHSREAPSVPEHICL